MRQRGRSENVRCAAFGLDWLPPASRALRGTLVSQGRPKNFVYPPQRPDQIARMSTFSIRPYLMEDIDEVYCAVDESREHVRKWMGWLTPDYSRGEVAKWVEHAVASWEREEEYEHLIIDTVDGAIAGACGLNFLDRTNGYCNLGYWVRASRIGQGAAHQAALLLRDFGFGTLALNRLEIVVADGNEFSRKVAESSGAIYEGLQRLRLKVGDTAYDAHMYALLNPSAKNIR